MVLIIDKYDFEVIDYKEILSKYSIYNNEVSFTSIKVTIKYSKYNLDILSSLDDLFIFKILDDNSKVNIFINSIIENIDYNNNNIDVTIKFGFLMYEKDNMLVRKYKLKQLMS